MSLLDYEKRFSALRMNQVAGRPSPHKVALLLAVIDGIESGWINRNRIYFDAALKGAFTRQFDLLASHRDQNSPHLPFFHLRGDGFWHHKVLPGKQLRYSQTKTVSSPGALRDLLDYAYLDDELFELMGNRIARELLKTSLKDNLDDKAIRALIQPEKDGWDWLECELLVADYMTMLRLDLLGERYSKASHRRALQHHLKGRSEGSIEYKHQNVSAVLIEMGMPYISGYKPAFNYQKQLEKVVLSYLAGHPAFIDEMALSADVATIMESQRQVNWDEVYDPEPPEMIPRVAQNRPEYLARRIDFSECERRNRKLGESAENFIYELEKSRLTQEGRPDLAAEVEWCSRDRGDGLGFDIRSFDARRDEECFVEVKATRSGKYQPFFISENERAFSNDYADAYRLYRVYEFGVAPRLFVLPGAVENHVRLIPKNYQARF